MLEVPERLCYAAYAYSTLEYMVGYIKMIVDYRRQ